MADQGERWIEWEIDPSTRSSVHLWTKYVPITGRSVGTGAADLFTLNPGTPAVNLVKNPSFESADLTMFTEIGVGTAPPDAGGRVTYDSDGQVAENMSGVDGQLNVAKVTAAGNSAVGSNGFYWKTTLASMSQYNSIATFSAYVRGTTTSAAGTVKLQIIDDADGAVLASSADHTLTDTFVRLNVGFSIKRGTPRTLRFAIVAASVWALNSKPYYVDAFMVENRADGKLTDYVDGDQAMTSGGASYEWAGTAELSESKRRKGINHIRGFKIRNDDTGSDDLYIAIDDTATTSSIHLKAGETFETNWPIDAKINISAIASASSTPCHGIVWGVHEN